MDRPPLLLVEDDADLRTQIKWGLTGQYEVLEAEDRSSALEQFQLHRPPVVQLDLGLPPRPNDPTEGFQTLIELLRIDPCVKVIIFTALGLRQHAIDAIRLGAFDFFHKPVGMEELRVTLRRALTLHSLERERRACLTPCPFTVECFEGMVAASPALREIFALVRKVSSSNAPILILGESGTGKEVIANAIHRQSARRDGPFVVINCAAIPENLLESELFGHEKGAFTGAHIQREGRIELSHQGTLFLDEIAELPPPLQGKLLRFLETQQLQRLGGGNPIAIQTRILAATNVDVQRAMAEGRFRSDLFFRLAVVLVRVPPLRERPMDILPLARALLLRHDPDGRRMVGFSPQALRALENHDWPGNVRELENRIRRAVILGEGPHITPEDLELLPNGGRLLAVWGGSEARSIVQIARLKEARSLVDKDLLMSAWIRSKGSVTRTAEALGVSRPTVYALLRRFGLRKREGHQD